MRLEKNNIIIRYANNSDRDELYRLWQDCFHDTDDFTDYYFNSYFTENKVLMLEDDGELKAMLHLNPYRFSIAGHEVDSYYVVGVATRADYRHRGAMTKLLRKVFEDCHKQHMAFVYLMPADEAIYRPTEFAYIYAQNVESKKFCMENVTAASVDAVQIRYRSAALAEDLELVASMANHVLASEYDMYTVRDSHYFERLQKENRVDGGDLLMLYAGDQLIGYLSYAKEEEAEGREFYVLPEYRAMASEWLLNYFDNVEGEFLPLTKDGVIKVPEHGERYVRPIIMGRIIDLHEWMRLMPEQKMSFTINIEVTDQWINENNGVWQWRCSGGVSSFELTEEAPDVSMRIDALMQWLTGYLPWDDLIEACDITLCTSCRETMKKILPLKNVLINEIV